MNWLFWVVLAGLFTGVLPILLGAVIWLIVLTVEDVIEKRERNKTKGAK